MFLRLKHLNEWLLKRLSRVTRSGRVIAEIDGLRFIAIFSVFMFHLQGNTIEKLGLSREGMSALSSFVEAVLRQGSFGVQLFFAISGFILAIPFARTAFGKRAPVHLKAYFLRRVTRLEPPYIINLLVFFALLVAYRGFVAADLTPHLLASMIYQHNIVYNVGSAVNSVAWSLEIEVQFYVLMPIFALVFRISNVVFRRGVLVGAMLVLGALASVVLDNHDSVLRLTLLGQAHYFAVGLLLADVYLASWNSEPTKNTTWDVVGLIAWIGIPSTLIGLQGLSSNLLLPILILCAYMGTFRGKRLSRMLSSRWIVVIGGMCYTIYLYHYLVISFVSGFTASFAVGTSFIANVLVQMLLIGPAVLVVGSLLFAAFERPFMKHWWKPRQN